MTSPASAARVPQRPAPDRLAIGVVTYRRPDQVARLLGALARLDDPAPAAVVSRVVVVDNDPAGSARSAVEKAAAAMDCDVVYEVEPEPGISAARNRVADLSSDCRLLAFIDDDEVPTPGWLKHLATVRAETGADLVAGPTLSVLPEGVPDWLEAAGVFDRPRLPTGASFAFAMSGNLLLDLRSTAALGSLFDNRFGLTGGSDTHLFMRARSAGLRMIWANEAEAHEYIPVDRANLGWILRRAFRAASTVGLCERDIYTGQRRLAVLTVRCGKGMVHALLGAATALRGLIQFRPATVVRGLRRMSSGAGMVAGAVGIRYVEYRRPAERAANKVSNRGTV